jgi:two-component system chemotaxis response regulator CheB
LQLKEGGRIRFRCHTGHAYSTEALMADMDRSIEDSLWNSIRTLQEKALLARHLEQHAREQAQSAAADMLDRLARHAEQRANAVRRAVVEAEVTESDNVESADAAPVRSERPAPG